MRGHSQQAAFHQMPSAETFLMWKREPKHDINVHISLESFGQVEVEKVV